MPTTPRDNLVALLVALLLLAVIGASVGWFVGTRVNEQRERDGYALSVDLD